MEHQKARRQQQVRRQFRVRKKLTGTPERPRLSIRRSLNHIYCQVIDDSSGRTLMSASSLDKDLRSQVGYGGNAGAATAIGKIVAERAKAAGITAVCFDRGCRKFHGRVAAVADALRENGVHV